MSLPLLLGPVGSLALPSVPEPCASVNAVARRSDNLQDIFERLLRSAQNNAEHIAAPSQPNIGTTPFEMTPQNVSGREDLAEQGEAPDDTSGKKVDKGKQNSTDSDGEKKSQDEKKDKEEENDEDDDDEGGDDGVEEENGDEEDSDEEEHSDQEEDEDEDEEEEEDGDEDDSGIPLDPNRKNQAGGASAKEKKHTMYHLVMPNPNRYAGHQDIGSDERYYYRKIIDDEENLRGYRRDNPSFAAAKSHGQEERITAGPDADRRPGPAKVEAKATTGHADGDGLPEWKKVIPKRQEQLDQEAKEKKPDDKESKGPQAWSDEDLRLNLVDQQKHFKNHKAGDMDDEYGKLTQKMLDMCNIK